MTTDKIMRNFSCLKPCYFIELTVSIATKVDFFTARTIEGHTSEKLSAETSTTGT